MTDTERGEPLRILITGVGGPTPASIAVSLKRFSQLPECQILGVDSNPLATGLYRGELFDSTAVVPAALSPDYWPSIERLVEQHRIDIAIVQPEVEVVEWSRRQFESELPCKALLPEYELAHVLVDKAEMTSALRDMSLVPVSVALNRDLESLAEVESVLSYPFWTRAASGSSGLGSLLVEDQEGLRSWIGMNRGVATFLCSEYLPGRNLACKLLYFEGDLIRAACAERVNYIMAKVAPSGITGNTSFGRFLNEPGPINRAILAMDHLAELTASRKHGLFTVDFKEDANGGAQITEINVRNVAFNGCFAQIGANFSEDIVRLLSPELEFDRNYKQYKFDDDYVFIRDVDVEPIVLRQSQLLSIGR